MDGAASCSHGNGLPRHRKSESTESSSFCRDTLRDVLIAPRQNTRICQHPVCGAPPEVSGNVGKSVGSRPHSLLADSSQFLQPRPFDTNKLLPARTTEINGSFVVGFHGMKDSIQQSIGFGCLLSK